MNRETGAAIGELAHIKKCITDILTTRIGTRVMHREYGSLLPELVAPPFGVHRAGLGGRRSETGDSDVPALQGARGLSRDQNPAL